MKAFKKCCFKGFFVCLKNEETKKVLHNCYICVNIISAKINQLLKKLEIFNKSIIN